MPAELKDLPGVRAHEVLLPEASVDSMWWVMHTEALLSGEKGEWRVRKTDRDNAPAGREVHWSSALVWLLVFLARLIHLASGKEVLDCVQHAALLAGPLMLAVFIVLFATGVARRWGYLAGGFFALALATNGPMLTFFKGGETDHHGIVSCFALACLLALAAGGAGWVARTGSEPARHALTPRLQSARRWFMLSGFFGAAGLWISASTMIPVLFGIALGVGMVALQGRRKAVIDHDDGVVFEPALWRWWGAGGAVSSLAFYLLEYAPSHFGWRFEVNHPLHAVALWGAGGLLAGIAAWGNGARLLDGRHARLRMGAALIAAAVLPTAILIGGTSHFAVQDAFLWRLHHEHIEEFRPFAKFFEASSWSQLLGAMQPWPLLAIPLLWLLFRRLKPEVEAFLLIPLVAMLPLCLLACLQERWVWTAWSLWLGVALVVLVAWRAGLIKVPRPLLWAGCGLYLTGLGAVPVLFPPQLGKQTASVINLHEAFAITTRDLAWTLRKTAGDGPMNVLSGPATTSKMAYYGDTKGLGTLYWENLEGLKAAAAVFAAKQEEDVLRLCHEHQITHLVIFSWENFGEPYALLHHDLPAEASAEDSYLCALLVKRSMPIWLRPLHFRLMPELEKLGHWVEVFEFRPEQKPAESYFHLGRYLAAGGQYGEALQAYAEALKRDPRLPAAEREIGVALAGVGRTADAQTLAARLPASDRFQIESALARRFTAEGRHGEAVAAWRRALEQKPENETASLELAWLLATSEDASVRNGSEAVELVDMLLEGRPPRSLREMDVLAAAKAENGRFAEALTLIEKALVVARNGTALNAVREIEQRKTHYAGNQPFRTPLKMGMWNFLLP